LLRSCVEIKSPAKATGRPVPLRLATTARPQFLQPPDPLLAPSVLGHVHERLLTCPLTDAGDPATDPAPVKLDYDPRFLLDVIDLGPYQGFEPAVFEDGFK
jgi:hypothetical protein